MKKQSHQGRQRGISLLIVLLCILVAACSSNASANGATPSPTLRSISSPTIIPIATLPVSGGLITWPAFDGGGSRSGINSAETLITPADVARLTRSWQVHLPAIADSSPVFLPHVQTSSGTKSLLFLTTLNGSLLAINATTGALVWEKDTQGPKFTTSSPALDPSGQFVYSYGLDGKVHKYAVANGAEVTSSGWPVTITLMPIDEKGSSALNITSNSLYEITSAYPGDGGHYEGHIVAVNLATGKTSVFNSLCSNIRQVLVNNSSASNYCADIQAGAWGRAGAVVDPITGNVFFTTGNGPFNANAGGQDYGDTVLELSPDLSRLIDTYTPENYQELDENDLDLSSASPALLPPQARSNTPYLAVQAGKDDKLRLLNRQNLSGQGGPNHVGGELQMVSLPQGCIVPTHPVAWNDTSGTTWVFVANNCGLSAFKVIIDASGAASLQLAYTNKDSGSSPFMADGLLFVQGSQILRALNPTSGVTLWSSDSASAGGSIGGLHWQSPIVVNGVVYVPDNDSNLTAYGLPTG